MTCKKNKILLLLCIFTLICSIGIYPLLPNVIPINFDINGEVNKYGSKMYSFLFAVIPLLLYALFVVIRKIDPKKENYKKHAKAYSVVKFSSVLLMIATYWLTIASSFGNNLRIDIIVPLASGVVLIIIGNYMPQVRHNYFLGIRTPWTLANKTVWTKTHRIGGYIFILSGFLFLICGLLGNALISTIAMSLSFVGVLFLFGYSYYLYAKLDKE